MKLNEPIFSEKTANSTIGIVAMVVVGLIVWVVIGVVVTSVDETADQDETSFVAELTTRHVIDPATIRVGVLVKNTGDKVGVPDCFIYASNPSETYKGHKVHDTNTRVKSGQEYEFEVQLTVNKEGAYYISQGYAECHPR